MPEKKTLAGLALCLAIAIPAYLAGQSFPLIGAPVFAILAGMIVARLLTNRATFAPGIRFASKKILQWAVILLGFGLDLGVIVRTGAQSLPIIVSTIAVALATAWALFRMLGIHAKTATLVGVGSSICGGSAIAATAPVVGADDEEVAQAISVIFFYNVIAALVFPALGSMLGMSTFSGEAFGVFAGTAVNDTSSVTAAAATWDSMWDLGTETLDTAVTVKLTRTLAIIPITLALAWLTARQGNRDGTPVSIARIFPMFILYFIGASLITTLALNMGVAPETFAPIKTLSKFLIVIAMAAIGLNTDVVKLVATGGKPLALGAACWIAITVVSLAMQYALGIW